MARLSRTFEILCPDEPEEIQPKQTKMLLIPGRKGYQMSSLV